MTTTRGLDTLCVGWSALFSAGPFVMLARTGPLRYVSAGNVAVARLTVGRRATSINLPRDNGNRMYLAGILTCMRTVIATVAAVVVAVALLAGCSTKSDPTPAAQAPAVATQPAKTTAAKVTKAPVAVPAVTGPNLDKADILASKAGLRLNPYDLGPAISGTNARTIIDRSNWVVLYQCPGSDGTVSGGVVNVGVLKADEITTDLRSAAASGAIQALVPEGTIPCGK